MRKLVFFLMMVGIPLGAGAQALNVRPLFENSSNLPHVLIPFQVTGSVITSGGRIQKVEVKQASGSSTSADCRGMIDPFHKDVFIVKCDNPATINVHVNIALGSQIHPLIYNGVEIVTPGTGLIVVNPDEPGGKDDDKADWTAGRALYNTHCLTCHGSGTSSTKKGKTAAQIKAAIMNPTLSAGQMQSSELTALTTKQLQQIQIYLAKP